MSIMSKCHRDNMNFKSEMDALEDRHHIEKMKTEKTFLIQQKMQQLEGMQPEIIGTILKYKEKQLKEEEEEALEVTIDFKKDTLDPDRPIVAWEKKANLQRRLKLSR